MRHKRHRIALGLGLVVAALALCVAPRLHASVVRALSLEELTRQAELVVVALPTEQRCRMHIDGKMIVTDVTLKVEDVLKGQAQAASTLVVTVLGGKLDGLGLEIPGEAGFALGKRVLAFLYRSQVSGDLRVVGMSQGVLPLVQQGTTTMVLPGGGGAALVDRGSDGVLHDAPPAFMQPLPLGDLLDRIRGIVRVQGR